jgi:hypothetical protein
MAVRIESQAEPIPGYRLIERLGGGGFGEVWKAEAPGGLLKAIKFVYGDLRTGDDEGIRAEQELKAMSRVKTVRHPYILSLERYDIIGGQLLIVMELADRNLWDRFRECRGQGLPGIPRDELLGYMEETAEALDLMNREYQLQHLDIKPQNLFLVHNHIKVADFGLVKDLEGMAASVTGGVTPVYAAPETFDGWVSRFCDQYSLAIVYQELLTGQRPFAGSNVRQLVLQHLQGVPDLSSLPEADRRAVARALAKNPDDRHPTCCHLVEGLRRGGARGPSTPSPAAEADGSRRDAGAVTRWIRAHDDPNRRGLSADTPGPTEPQQVVPPSDPGSGPRTPTEAVGDGVLFPALVIGLGSFGLEALKRLSANLGERFGDPEALPHLRLLHIDTDPDAVRQATAGPEGTGLRRGEVLLAPLHRPSHYLKPRDGKVLIDSWLDPKMLYRIPRQAFSAGTRALGRLAFVDNYRTIALRLRAELQECLNPDSLAETAQQTGLGLRMGRPRVYVVTSLAGGTGSGMFLDLAYVVRTLLRQLGVLQSEIVGVLLLPDGSPHPSQPMSLGNAYAALTELNHFSAPGTTFEANYDTKEAFVTGPIADSGAPFNRCILLPMPRPRGSQLAGAVAGAAAPDTQQHPQTRSRPLDLIGQFLTADLTTPLGRNADLYRREHLVEAARDVTRPPGLLFQTFGMHRVVWPRRALVKQAGRRLTRQLVGRWMSKDAGPIREQVKAWVKEQWQAQELGPEHLIAALQAACEQAVGKEPESALAALIEPALGPPSDSAVNARGVPRGEKTKVPEPLDPQVLVEVMNSLEHLLGKPTKNETVTKRPGELVTMAVVAGTGSAPPPPGVLEEALRTRGQALVGKIGQKLAEMAVSLIEQPAYRLAGAEESLRQISATIEQVLQHQEQLAKEFAERALNAYEALFVVWQQLQAAAAARAARGRSAPASFPVADLLRTYTKCRYQGLVLARVTGIYVSLRGQLSDQMQEVGFCRNRLKELCRSLEADQVPGDPSLEEGPGLGRYLFPAGMLTLEEAGDKLFNRVQAADVQELDGRLQALIREQFTALVHVCLTASNMLKSLEAVMLREAEAVLAQKLVGCNVVDMYVARHTDGEAGTAGLAQEIASAFTAATPELNGLVTDVRKAHSAEVVILEAPAASLQSGAPRLLEVARQAAGGHPIIFAEAPAGPASDEVVFYREETCLRFADLKLLGPLGRDAYRQMNNVEHFTPHTRMDITEWQPAGNQ